MWCGAHRHRWMPSPKAEVFGGTRPPHHLAGTRCTRLEDHPRLLSDDNANFPSTCANRATRGPEESGASAGESCRSRHRSSASAAPRSALPRLRTRLAGSATARRRAGARPPPLRLLPCAPLDVGREDRFPLGTRLREDRARVVSGGARAISVPGHAGRSGMGSQAQNSATASERRLLLLPPPLRSPRQTRCRRSRRRRRRRRLAPRLRHRRPPSRGGVPLMARAPRSPARLAAAPLSPPLRSWPPPPLSIPPSAPPLPPPRASPPPPPPSPSPLSGAWRASHRVHRPRVCTACAHSLLLCTLTAPPAPPRMQLGAWVSGVSREVAHR